MTNTLACLFYYSVMEKLYSIQYSRKGYKMFTSLLTFLAYKLKCLSFANRNNLIDCFQTSCKGLPGTNTLTYLSTLPMALKHILTLTTCLNFMNFLE